MGSRIDIVFYLTELTARNRKLAVISSIYDIGIFVWNSFDVFASSRIPNLVDPYNYSISRIMRECGNLYLVYETKFYSVAEELVIAQSKI